MQIYMLLFINMRAIVCIRLRVRECSRNCPGGVAIHGRACPRQVRATCLLHGGFEVIEIVRLVAARVAAVLFLGAGFQRMRGTLDHMHDDLVRIGRWTSAGAIAAAVAFGCEVAAHFWPNLLAPPL
jgi:hypothetical protein